MIPEYSKGISQPPKLTIFAPRRRWTEFSAVLRNSTAADVFTEGFPLARRNIERSMRVLECQGRRPLVIFAAAPRLIGRLRSRESRSARRLWPRRACPTMSEAKQARIRPRGDDSAHSLFAM